MMVSRTVAAIVLAGGLVASCTSSGNGNGTSPPPSPSASGSTTNASGPCTRGTATTAKFTNIDADGFMPSCVKIKAGAQFLFINNARKRHSVTTRKGAPASFDVQLPRKTSTYARKFKKKGKYVVVDKTTDETMTLFVT
jgi:plastocyanin